MRQSVATGVNITYKILYNDAVAMTGGQPVDGTLSVPQIAHMMSADPDGVDLDTRRRNVIEAAKILLGQCDVAGALGDVDSHGF